MALRASFRINRGSSEFMAKWKGNATQHLNIGVDQEATTHFEQYEVQADGVSALVSLAISDFVLERAREKGVELLDEYELLDELFVYKFGNGNVDQSNYEVTFLDLDTLFKVN